MVEGYGRWVGLDRGRRLNEGGDGRVGLGRREGQVGRRRLFPKEVMRIMKQKRELLREVEERGERGCVGNHARKEDHVVE